MQLEGIEGREAARRDRGRLALILVEALYTRERGEPPPSPARLVDAGYLDALPPIYSNPDAGGPPR